MNQHPIEILSFTIIDGNEVIRMGATVGNSVASWGRNCGCTFPITPEFGERIFMVVFLARLVSLLEAVSKWICRRTTIDDRKSHRDVPCTCNSSYEEIAGRNIVICQWCVPSSIVDTFSRTFSRRTGRENYRVPARTVTAFCVRYKNLNWSVRFFKVKMEI